MAKVKLGSREFGADCEEIAVPWHCGRIADAECVALGARMRVGDFQRLRIMQLVSFLFLSKMFAAGNALFAVSLLEFGCLSLLALNPHGLKGFTGSNDEWSYDAPASTSDVFWTTPK